MTEEQKNNQGAQPIPEQPPVTQQMPSQQPSAYAAPQPQAQPQPYYAPMAPAPLTQLTGGMKFGWVLIGILVGIPGILLAWLINVDKMPQVKSDAIKFSIIGFVGWIVLGLLLTLLLGGMMAAMMASIAPSAYSTW